MKHRVLRLALSAVLYCQLKLLFVIWFSSGSALSLEETQYEEITVEELNFILSYFKAKNFKEKFFFKNQQSGLPDYVKHSAICIPKNVNKRKCDIYLFCYDYPINRGSYGALFVGRKMDFQFPNNNEKIVIKFQNTLHKKRDRRDWIKNYANHLLNEISYLRKFGSLRFVGEQLDELQATSLVLVFDFVEGHHMYSLIDNGLIESMDHFEQIESTVYDELKKFHKKGFCHGDLHGQNFLVELPKQPESKIKISLIDFGWTHEIKTSDDECITEDINRLKRAFDIVRKCLKRNLLRRFIKPCKFSPF